MSRESVKENDHYQTACMYFFSTSSVNLYQLPPGKLFHNCAALYEEHLNPLHDCLLVCLSSVFSAAAQAI